MSTILVTGASGHVGVFTVIEYIRKGYTVHTTIRDISKKDEVLDMIVKTGNLSEDEGEKIVFFEADLTKDDKWDVAIKGVDVVCHVAYPFINNVPYEELERGAVTGTLHLLKLAVQTPSVKQFIFCSSFVAVGFSEPIKDHIITEADWTSLDSPYIDGYMKSKTVVEKRMWDFINSKESNPNGLKFTSINPYVITGPLPVGYTRFVGVPKMMELAKDGLSEEFPSLYYGVVDVRDLAKSFVVSTGNPKTYGERFIMSDTKEYNGQDILELLTKRFPKETEKFPKKPTALMVPSRPFTNKKAKEILGYDPIDSDDSICETFKSVYYNTLQ